MKLRLGLVLLLGSLTTLAHAYVDNALTLGAVIKQSTHITVVRVYKVNRDKRAIIFKKVADLKGKEAAEEIKHQISDHGFHHRTSRTILDWAEQAQESGRVAILFRNDKVTQVCLGTYWYECAAQQTPPWWSMNDGKPELSLAYFGTTEKLRTHVATMLAGKPTIITCLPHGQNGFGAYFHIAFRTAPGSKDFPLQRVRASLDMPAVVYRIGKDPKYFVGLGAADAKEVPPLIELLKHKETRVRAEAAEELGMIGPNAKDAVTALAGALEDREVQVRLSAATSLALVDPGHKALVPALIAWLKAGVPRERWSAAEILGQVGADAEAAIPALLEALKDKSLRGVAADALGGIGPKCRAAVPDLVKVLKDDDVQVRYSAAVALARIGGPGTQPAVPILMEMWTVKGDAWNASLYIGALGPEAKETVPFLLKNVTHHNAWTLWSVDPRAAIPYLNIADIGNDESFRHYWSSAYFRMVGPRTKEMAEALTEGLRDGKVPQVASWATNLLRTEAKSTVPILIRGLKSNDATIRVNSARVLGQIGPAAKEAVAALKTAVKDEDNRVRQAATQSLKQVQAK